MVLNNFDNTEDGGGKVSGNKKSVDVNPDYTNRSTEREQSAQTRVIIVARFIKRRSKHVVNFVKAPLQSCIRVGMAFYSQLTGL